MRWEDERLSDHVLDNRGASFGGGGGVPLMLGGGGLGTVVLIVLALLFGVDPRMLLQGGEGGSSVPATQEPASGLRSNDEDARFASTVLAFTEDTWGDIFTQQGGSYRPPTLVLYEQGHPTGCGFGQSAMGPFYCPADQRIYLDLSFFRELSGRFGAPGRFAEAYVIAHEVGHHIQNLIGVSEETQRLQQRLSRAEGNRVSVRVELQADCFAGVWAARTEQREQFLDAGDVEQGLRAASAVGDDNLQRQTQGRVVPDAFTHGTSEQRTRWFQRGLESGRPEACDTYQVDYSAL
jgi:predicted metalloprotease